MQEPHLIQGHAPAGMPQMVPTQLRNELQAIARLPDVIEEMVAQRQTPIVDAVEEFVASCLVEYAKSEALVKASGAKVE